MNYVDELKKDPIFAMSLSSKELFHSNFWAWLFERENVGIEYARIFFPDIISIKGIMREQKHRDLTIWASKQYTKRGKEIFNDAYVIENKFKSLPNKEQLLRYQNDFGQLEDGDDKNSKEKRFVKGVVTGIIKPDFIENSELYNWNFIDYKKIGNEIKRVADKYEEDEYEKKIIIQYGEMIIKLYELLVSELELNGNRWNAHNQNCNLIRINDIYSKLLASKLTLYLRENLKIPHQVGDYNLVIEQYYGMNGAGADIRYVLNDRKNKEKISVIGLQIEGTQYRWCVQRNKKMKGYSKETDRFFEELYDKGWFVDYDYTSFANKSQKTIIDHITKEKRDTSMGAVKGHSKESIPYRIYQGDYTFLYQYWLIENLTFEEICKNLQRDLDFAESILKQMN